MIHLKALKLMCSESSSKLYVLLRTFLRKLSVLFLLCLRLQTWEFFTTSLNFHNFLAEQVLAHYQNIFLCFICNQGYFMCVKGNLFRIYCLL